MEKEISGERANDFELAHFLSVPFDLLFSRHRFFGVVMTSESEYMHQ